MDDALRSSLWNTLSMVLDGLPYPTSDPAWSLAARCVAAYVLKIPADDFDIVQMPRLWLRRRFLSEPWFTVYDMVEHLVERSLAGDFGPNAIGLLACMDETLKAELAGYRYIRDVLSPISDDIEKEAIEAALTESPESARFSGAREHLATALHLLGKKPEPDYRNSMKESISAVESAVRALPGMNETNFRKALAKLAKQVGIHRVLEDAFCKLFEYTSDEDGVRHGIVDDPSVGFDEAKFLLVACSAFVNFLVAKSAALPA